MPISIAIPVYNEDEILSKNVDKLCAMLKRGDEILICSNGSTDRTNEIGLELERKRKIRFFTLPEKGVGNAFIKCVKHAKNDKIITLDMDLTTDLKFIREASRLLDRNDIVVGSKQAGHQERSFFRKLISGVFISMTKALLGLSYSDYSIGVKGYRKEKIRKYLDRLDWGSSYVIELIYFVKKNGGVVKEIPVLCNDNRVSKFNLSQEISHRLFHLLSFKIKLLKERL